MKVLKKIAILPGDGIGPEVMEQAIKVLDAIQERFGHKFMYCEGQIGRSAIAKTGHPFPEHTLDTCEEADAILLGAIGDSTYSVISKPEDRPEHGLLELRRELGLFANVRPIKIYDQLKGLSVIKNELLKGVDMIVVRELSGGLYYGDHIAGEDKASDSCVYHRYQVERIAHLAFQLASKREGKLTLVDKANVLATSRFWRNIILEIQSQYPEVKVDYIFIDNAAVQLMLDPARFDVLLCPNLFGDIISEEASVLTGSLGLLASRSIGENHRVYGPVHGAHPEKAGKDIANPLATILSVEMMLRDADLYNEADTVLRAVDFCMEKSIMTEDLNPDINYSCSQMGDIIQTLIVEGPEALKTKFLLEANSTIV